MKSRVDKFSSSTIDILNSMQYLLSAIIGVLFGIGLIPFLYDDVMHVLIFIIIIQIIISFIRMRFLNVFIEIFLLGLSLLSWIPLLGYVFRFSGIIFGVLDMASFKNSVIYRQMEIRTFSRGNSEWRKGKGDGREKKKSKRGVRNKDVVDAEFSEK